MTISQPAPQPSLDDINEVLLDYIEICDENNCSVTEDDDIWAYLDGVEKAREIIQETQPNVEQINDILNDYMERYEQEMIYDEDKDKVYSYLDGVERARGIVQSHM